MAEMWQLKPLLLLLAVVLSAPACTVAGDGGMPLVIPITKDAATLLYSVSAPVAENDQITNHLVLDLSGPIIWSTCPDGYVALGCTSPACMQAHRFHPPNCPQTGYGKPDADNPRRCKCTAHPYNPVSGDTASDDMTEFTTTVNTTDGKNPLKEVSFVVATSCAPESLLAGLPENDVGVVGLGRSALALPAQIADTQKVPNKFALCLPSAVSNGVAIFGGGPLQLTAQPGTDYTQSLEYTPLLAKKDNPAYYVSVKSILVEDSAVHFPPHALDTGGAVLCTRVPYTLLRPDVYGPFVAAFGNAMKAQNATSVKAVAPFKLCYDARKLANTRLGYLVPGVHLALDGGKIWRMTGVHSMVDVNQDTACLAFVEMKGVKAGDGNAPAVIVGGFQMENFVLQFDLEKKQLGFFKLPFFTNCGQFNFTRSA